MPYVCMDDDDDDGFAERVKYSHQMRYRSAKK